jgi:hypothetical protein
LPFGFWSAVFFMIGLWREFFWISTKRENAYKVDVYFWNSILEGGRRIVLVRILLHATNKRHPTDWPIHPQNNHGTKTQDKNKITPRHLSHSTLDNEPHFIWK